MYTIEENIILLLPVVLPTAVGTAILMVPGFDRNRGRIIAAVLGTLLVEAALAGLALATGGSLVLWQLTETVALSFHVDGISRLFAALTVGVWLLVGIYSVSYMKETRLL